MKFGVILVLFVIANFASAYVNNRGNCKAGQSKCVPFVECAHVYTPFMKLREIARKPARSEWEFANLQKTRQQLTGFIDAIHHQSCGFDYNNPSIPMFCCPIIKSEGGSSNGEAAKAKDESALITEHNKQFKCGTTLRKEYFGHKTDLDDHPWLALLEYDAWNGSIYQKKIMCGGVLVSDRHVLTSIECLSSLANNISSVILGEHDLRTAIDCIDEGDSENSVSCADAPLKIGVSNVYFERELALIELNEQVKFSYTVQPICLPEKKEITKQIFTVAGWSKSLIPGELGHSQKLQTQLSEIKDGKCHPQVIFSKYRHICAGTPKQSACIADGGGPLMGYEVKKDGSIRVTVLGVSTMSLSCTMRETKYLPGVFEKVHSYVKWIREYVKADEE